MAEAVKKVEFFQIRIDGKVFGPFPKTKQRRFQALRHRAGVVFLTVLVDAETVRKQKAESRKQKAESRKQMASAQPSLLEGLGWVPVHKR